MRIAPPPALVCCFREPLSGSGFGPARASHHPQRNAEVVAITEWLSRCLLTGHRVMLLFRRSFITNCSVSYFGRIKPSALPGSKPSPQQPPGATFHFPMKPFD
jgi:hypothetical protein